MEVGRELRENGVVVEVKHEHQQAKAAEEIVITIKNRPKGFDLLHSPNILRILELKIDEPRVYKISCQVSDLMPPSSETSDLFSETLDPVRRHLYTDMRVIPNFAKKVHYDPNALRPQSMVDRLEKSALGTKCALPLIKPPPRSLSANDTALQPEEGKSIKTSHFIITHGQLARR